MWEGNLGERKWRGLKNICLKGRMLAGGTAGGTVLIKI